jgi:hypothetical protein
LRNKLAILGTILIGAVGIFAGLAVGGTPPGQDPCSHGATNKPCKPDPQPNHGKDCLHHGKKGGVNEDHCLGTTTGTTTTSTTDTTGTTGTTGTTESTRTVTVPVTNTTTNTNTVTVVAPGPTTTNTVTVTTPGKVIVKKKIIVKHRPHVVSHHLPKTTG